MKYALSLMVWTLATPLLPLAWATDDLDSIRFGDQALTYSSGSIQRSTPHDGFVNVITGDNQTTGDHMILGSRDVLYLKLKNPGDVTLGDLFTIYRRAHKVFHPITGEYLGHLVNRLAVVQVSQIDKELTTVQIMRAYGPVSPGDPVMKFVLPTNEEAAVDQPSTGDVEGRGLPVKHGHHEPGGTKKCRISGPGAERRDQTWGSNGRNTIRREPSSTGRGRIKNLVYRRSDCHGTDHKVDLACPQG
jgi:hypothetical protein